LNGIGYKRPRSRSARSGPTNGRPATLAGLLSSRDHGGVGTTADGGGPGGSVCGWRCSGGAIGGENLILWGGGVFRAGARAGLRGLGPGSRGEGSFFARERSSLKPDTRRGGAARQIRKPGLDRWERTGRGSSVSRLQSLPPALGRYAWGSATNCSFPGAYIL